MTMQEEQMRLYIAASQAAIQELLHRVEDRHRGHLEPILRVVGLAMNQPEIRRINNGQEATTP